MTVLARACAGQSKRHRDEWAETIGELRDRTTNCGLIGDVFGARPARAAADCANNRSAVIGLCGLAKSEAATAARDIPAGVRSFG